jgi:hypothetical protein
MEEALTDAGEAFHLLYYTKGNGSGPDGFVERSPDGVLRFIERPDNLRRLGSAAHVVAKLNGGLTYHNDIKDDVLIERAHFERLAAQIPAILPAFLREELRTRSLLFLGHGLGEPDIHAIIKYASSDDRVLRSWAVQLPPTDPIWRRTWEEGVSDWRRWGLKILADDLEHFIASMHRSLLQSMS